MHEPCRINDKTCRRVCVCVCVWKGYEKDVHQAGCITVRSDDILNV